MSDYCMGEIIKKNRKRHNLTQEDLAFGICSVSTLSRIENGLETPERATFERIVARFRGIKELPEYDATEDEAYRLRYVAVRNIIRGQEEKNGFLLDEYATLGRKDSFTDYIRARDGADENESVEILKSILGKKGIGGDGSGLEYAVLEPYEAHAFILCAKNLREKRESEKAEKALNALRKSLEESYNLAGIYGELYIELLTECADIAVTNGNSEAGLAACALALEEIERRGKSFQKKKVFDIKAKAYKLDGKTELECECRNYAHALAELIKSCAGERKKATSVSMFNYT